MSSLKINSEHTYYHNATVPHKAVNRQSYTVMLIHHDKDYQNSTGNLSHFSLRDFI